jgi:hypothetical protein
VRFNSIIFLKDGFIVSCQHPLIAVSKMSVFSRLLYRNGNSATYRRKIFQADLGALVQAA